ncbi:hypothetical protein [Salinimicrobium soli]|uniref:hypothetical protein n=1 Tax=Salinimicrobium soli TaxID=1254399 RepID=UPI003AB040B4
MKKIAILFLFGLSLSCAAPDLVGKYTWQETSGGITGRVDNAGTPSEIPALVITRDSIKEYEKGILMGARAYHFETRKSIRTGKREKMIVYDDGSTPHSFEVKGNELVLYEECFDCYQYRYVKE